MASSPLVLKRIFFSQGIHFVLEADKLSKQMYPQNRFFFFVHNHQHNINVNYQKTRVNEYLIQ